MKRIALALFGLVVACGGQLVSSDEPGDAAIEAGPSPYAAECVGAAMPPDSIKCTGLYTDVATKKLADGVRAYAPAVPLWADTADKSRWIYLPPGTKIDATDPNEWNFPLGTKLWKEFIRDGKVVETRLWQKVQQGFWVNATYAWNADLTEANVSAGGDLPWGTDGGVYHIPTNDECLQCHKGRTDRILGFEQVSLGLAGATGLTLAELVKENLIAPIPSRTNLTVGDDGTGAAAAPLKWLHINCGTTCHNDNSNSTAFGASMRLRLDPTLLDGRSSANFPSRLTTLGIAASTPAWGGHPRIVPGDPTNSLLVELITNRGTNNPVSNQMPPIATLLVDQDDSKMVADWISKMTPLPGQGGGDAAADATVVDAGIDATVGEEGGNDATVGPDASVVDGDSGGASTDDAPIDGGSETAVSDEAGSNADDGSQDTGD